MKKQFYVNCMWLDINISGLIAPCDNCNGTNTHFDLAHGCSCQGVQLALICNECEHIKIIYDSNI